MLIAAVALLTATGVLEEEEVLCEEAIAHLRDCCTLDVPNVCGDAPGSCQPETTLLTVESRCILELECGEQAQEVCNRIQLLSDATAEEELPPEGLVCP